MDMIIPNGAALCIHRLEAHGYEAYLVGGCVRDTLLGREPKDFDICTSALPDQMQEIFADFHTIDNGLKHGTLGVIVHGEVYEITTFRTDIGYSDHRHPDSVSFVGELSLDLARRDFTVNAMAYGQKQGVIDLFGGRDDLEGRTIRTVGDPICRFEEDGLRILRGLRFASVYNFEIDDATSRGIHECRDLLCDIAAERIFVEFKKLICGSGAGRIIKRYLDVIEVFLPELSTLLSDRVLLNATLDALRRLPAEPTLRFAALFSRLSAKAADSALVRLRSDRSMRDRCAAMLMRINSDIPTDRVGVRRLICDIGTELSGELLVLRYAMTDDSAQRDAIEGARIMREMILSSEGCFTLRDMPIGGDDLIALGCPCGREIGAILSALFEDVICERLPCERNTLIEAAKTKIKFYQNC